MLTPAFALIPGAWFTMGTQFGHEDERPPCPFFVDRFDLGVCPVTRAEYEGFVDATRHEPPRDWSHPPFAQPDLPVVGVSWIDAVAYCAWRSEQDRRPVRLPTEHSWGTRTISHIRKIGPSSSYGDSDVRCRRGFLQGSQSGWGLRPTVSLITPPMAAHPPPPAQGPQARERRHGGGIRVRHGRCAHPETRSCASRSPRCRVRASRAEP